MFCHLLVIFEPSERNQFIILSRIDRKEWYLEEKNTHIVYQTIFLSMIEREKDEEEENDYFI